MKCPRCGGEILSGKKVHDETCPAPKPKEEK